MLTQHLDFRIATEIDFPATEKNRYIRILPTPTNEFVPIVLSLPRFSPDPEIKFRDF
jgi:hypothetical protein